MKTIKLLFILLLTAALLIPAAGVLADDDTQAAEVYTAMIDQAREGYTQVEAVPVYVKNTGSEPIVSPTVTVAENSSFEIIVNRTPTDIQPGETDSETWSVRPRIGLAYGEYIEVIYLNSPGFAEPVTGDVNFYVTVAADPNDPAFLEADSVDFGELTVGYEHKGPLPLVASVVGEGRMTGIKLDTHDADLSFFDINEVSPSIDLSAGEDSGFNWTVTLKDGLEPGDYETLIRFTADEAADPATVRIKAKVKEGVIVSPEKTSLKYTDPYRENRVWIYAAAGIGVLAIAAVAVLAVRSLLNGQKDSAKKKRK